MSTTPSLLIPNFQRAWKITLFTKSNGTVELSSDKIQDPLRVHFSIEMRALLAYWTAEVSIYNLNNATSNAARNTGIPPDKLWKFNQPILFGDQLSISAGYRFGSGGKFDPDANLVWLGNVLQPLWTKEDALTYRVTLRCLLGLMQDALGIVNTSFSANQTQYDQILKIAQDGKIEVNEQNLDKDALSKAKLPRGLVLNGRPYDLLRQIAKANNLQSWVGPNGLHVRSLKFNPNTVPDYAYAPPGATGNLAPKGTKTGIIKKTLLGVPIQTQNGVNFRVLLDALPKIGDIVQIPPNLAINQLPLQIGRFPAILDSGGMYVVGGVRHVGDTRGRDWYTEVTGFTDNFFPDFLAQGTPNVTGG